jgi:hypothetical protein
MSAGATILNLTAKYTPSAISAAKSILAKFAPNAASAIETTAEVISATVADGGYAKSLLNAKELIGSTGNSFGSQLLVLSNELGDSYPELASKLDKYASKLMIDRGILSEDEMKFIHDQLLQISNGEEAHQQNTTVTAKDTKQSLIEETLNDNIRIITTSKDGAKKEKAIETLARLVKNGDLTEAQIDEAILSVEVKIPTNHETEVHTNEFSTTETTNHLESDSTTAVESEVINKTDIADIPFDLLEKAFTSILGNDAVGLIKVLRTSENLEALGNNFNAVMEHQPNFLEELFPIINGENVPNKNFLTTAGNLFYVAGNPMEPNDVNNLHMIYNRRFANPSETTPSLTPEAPGADSPETARTDQPEKPLTQADLQAAYKKGQEETARTSNNTTGEIKLDSGDIHHDVGVLERSVLEMLTKELSRPDTIYGALYDMARKDGMPESSDKAGIQKYLQEQLFGKENNAHEFTNAVTQYLGYLKGTRTEKPNIEALNTMQKRAYHGMTWGLWIAKYIPSGVQRFLGKMKLITPIANGFLGRIPVVGHFLVWGLSMFNEYGVGTLMMHSDNVQNMTNAADKYKPQPSTTQPAASNAA